MRDCEVLRTLKVPPMEAQLAVDKLRLATKIAESQQALALVISPAGAESREEFVQAMELVAEVMKRIILARAAAGVAEFEKKAQGTVCATGCLDQKQEWLSARCGKWFPSQAACIGHQSIHGRDRTRSLVAGSQCPK